MSTIRTLIRLTGMRRKEGLVRSARWAAGLLWRDHQASISPSITTPRN